MYRLEVEILEKVAGPEDPKVAAALSDLAECYHAQRESKRAAPLYKRALSILEKSYGPTHPSLAPSLTGYANALRQSRQDGEAKQVEMRLRLLGTP
jgi:hypothetical protein